jgi:hypothetical protein
LLWKCNNVLCVPVELHVAVNYTKITGMQVFM